MRRPVLLAALAALLVAPAGASATVAYTTGWDRLATADDRGGARAPLGVRGWGEAVSPDGSRLAYFTGPIGEPRALVIRDLAGGAVVRAAAADAPWVSLQGIGWAPDGSALLVETQAADARGYVTGEGLAVVDAATGAATTVVPARGSQLAGYGWSPDAQRIAYGRGPWGGPLYGSGLYAAARDGTGAVRLGPGANPVWGPARIALQRHTRERWRGMRVWHAQIWTVDPAQGARSARRLTRFRPRHGLVFGPWAGWWTPDGRTLVGGIGGEDYSEPVRIDAATGRIRYLRLDGERRPDAVAVGLSADGATVLVERGLIGGNPSFWRVPLAGGDAVRMLRGATSVSAPAGWAP